MASGEVLLHLELVTITIPLQNYIRIWDFPTCSEAIGRGCNVIQHVVWLSEMQCGTNCLLWLRDRFLFMIRRETEHAKRTGTYYGEDEFCAN